MLVDDKLAKEKLARILDDAAKDARCDYDVYCSPCPCGEYENGLAELIRNTDLTDCQPQISGEAAEIVAALRKHDPVRSPYKTAFTMENAARFIEELVGVIAPAPDQGSVRNATELAFILRRIIDELPAKRDWLDPDLEKVARAAIRALPDQKD